MYLYGAQIQAKPGRGGEAGAKVAELRDVITAAIDQPGYAWAVAAGAPVGGFMLSTRLEGMADLIDIQMKMATDDDYQKLSAGVADLWAAPVETQLAQVVATAGEPGEPKPVLSVTRATIAGGHMADAMAWANQVLEHVAGVTGLSGMLAMGAAGDFLGMTWLFGSDSGAASDAANEALMADADYIGLVDRGGGYIVDGSAERVILVQLP
ncbi:MAG: hypothetical protein ACR2QO_05880 [Acidimicrobiales bacterium]